MAPPPLRPHSFLPVSLVCSSCSGILHQDDWSSGKLLEAAVRWELMERSILLISVPSVVCRNQRRIYNHVVCCVWSAPSDPEILFVPRLNCRKTGVNPSNDLLHVWGGGVTGGTSSSWRVKVRVLEGSSVQFKTTNKPWWFLDGSGKRTWTRGTCKANTGIQTFSLWDQADHYTTVHKGLTCLTAPSFTARAIPALMSAVNPNKTGKPTFRLWSIVINHNVEPPPKM